MLILRIRQAETALADGRLDEAYELVRADDVRSHRKGQEIIGELARKLIERGRMHLAGGRISEALVDCEKAGKLGGNLADAAELRSQIADAFADQQAQVRKQREAVDAANKHLDVGDLSAADAVLNHLPADASKVAEIQHRVGHLRNSAEAAMQRAEAAAARGDWENAAEDLRDARRAHGQHARLGPLTTQVRVGLTTAVRECLQQGRLERADLLTQALAGLAGDSGDVREFKAMIAHCRQAMGCIDRGQFRQADEILRRLRGTLPEAAWIGSAQEAVRQAAEKLEEVRGGPLGWWTVEHGPADRAGSEQETIIMPPSTRRDDDDLPTKFLLRVDGVGSFLVVRKDNVSIGPISASRPPDVALLAEPGMPVATVERDEDDYFVRCPAEIATMNAAQHRRKLLTDGDRIALSPRCSLRFTQPHAASSSAVLHLSGSRLPQSDARRIILMDRSFVIGPGSGSHVRSDALSRPVVLHVRDGRLFCRAQEEVTVNGRPADASGHIGIGTNVCVAGVSFHVAKV